MNINEYLLVKDNLLTVTYAASNRAANMTDCVGGNVSLQQLQL